MANLVVLRVQSPLHGTKRIVVAPSCRIVNFLAQVRSAFVLPRRGWTVWVNREKSVQLKSTKAKTLNSYQFKHGDMLYLDIQPQVTAMLEDNLEENGSKDKQPSLAAAGALLTGDSDDAARALCRDLSGSIVEDEVDQFLWKQDGTIPREKNEHCRHGSKGKCFHCLPYEPYDEEYLAKVNPPIKFLSFHSYLRKLTGGVDKGKFAQLENLSCKIKPGCQDHPPWPRGLCTKCQPNAITLQRQKYRHVDFIQFENHLMVERFLEYWRTTGNQRLGYLYGRYEYHKDVPLGIKAVVSAIYEPLQVSTKSSIELVQDEDEVVNSIAAKLGLRKVGWIFTDLVPLDTSTGTVKHFRGNVNSHFLSAEECIMAADLQNRHPNPCRLSPEGHFGSKFVTVVVTGDSQNQIHFDGYQVSNQCMALVRDDCLVPTKDASELGYAKESTTEQYVPDVFYKVTDKYGNEVTKLARPLPVEHLVVDVEVAFPKELAFTDFASEAVHPFSIEHREGIGETQEFTSFAEYFTQFNGDRPVNMFCDLHRLTYLSSCNRLPLKIGDIPAEVLQPILLNVITESVSRQLVNRQKWMEKAKEHVTSLSSVSEFWKAVVASEYFSILLGRRLCITVTKPTRLDIIHRMELPKSAIDVSYLKGEVVALCKESNKKCTLQFYKLLNMRRVIRVIDLNDSMQALEICVCSLTGCVYVVGHVGMEVRIVKLEPGERSSYAVRTVIFGSPYISSKIAISHSGEIIALWNREQQQKIIVLSGAGNVLSEISIPQNLQVLNVLCKGDHFLLVSYEGFSRKYVEIDGSGVPIGFLSQACTESLSCSVDCLDRLFTCGISFSEDCVKLCIALFDCELMQMQLEVSDDVRTRLQNCNVVKFVRERNEMLMYAVGNCKCYLNFVKLF